MQRWIIRPFINNVVRFFVFLLISPILRSCVRLLYLKFQTNEDKQSADAFTYINQQLMSDANVWRYWLFLPTWSLVVSIDTLFCSSPIRASHALLPYWCTFWNLSPTKLIEKGSRWPKTWFWKYCPIFPKTWCRETSSAIYRTSSASSLAKNLEWFMSHYYVACSFFFFDQRCLKFEVSTILFIKLTEGGKVLNLTFEFWQ